MTQDHDMSPWSRKNLKKVNQNNINLTSNDLWPCHVTSKCVTRILSLCTYGPSLVANLFQQEQLDFFFIFSLHVRNRLHPSFVLRSMCSHVQLTRFVLFWSGENYMYIYIYSSSAAGINLQNPSLMIRNSCLWKEMFYKLEKITEIFKDNHFIVILQFKF